MPKESNLPLKVGLFVLSAFVVGGILIFSISDFATLEKGQTFHAVFGFANGLKKASPVRFAGVECGIVKDIKVYFDKKEGKSKVQIDFWVKSQTEIPTDSVLSINQLGLLGEKYLEILPGTAPDLMKDDSTITGRDPIPVEKISEMITQLASKVDQSVDGFNSVVNNQKNQKSIEAALEGLSVMMTQVREGKGTVGKLFFDPNIYNNLDEFTSDLKANPWKLLYRPRSAKP